MTIQTKPPTLLKCSSSQLSTAATHWLHCSHCIGQNRTHYRMKSIPLKNMEDGRVKLLVFGERHWRGRDHIKRIRYVPWNRITVIQNKVSNDNSGSEHE